MKPENLNNVFDAISPSTEQKEKMFAEIMKAKVVSEEKRRVPFPYKKYAVAASLAVAVGIAAFVTSNEQKSDMATSSGSGGFATSDKSNRILAVESSYNADSEKKTENKYEVSAEENSMVGDVSDYLKDEEEIMADSVEKEMVAEANTIPEKLKIEKTESKASEQYSANERVDEVTKNIGSENDESLAIPPKGSDVKDRTENRTESFGNQDKNHSVGEEGVAEENPKGSSVVITEEDAVPSVTIADKVIVPETSETEDTPSINNAHATKGGSVAEPSSGKPASGGSGGGGGGAVSAVRNISYGEILTHSIYARLFPTYIPEGFRFSNGSQSASAVEGRFVGEDGKSVVVTITKYAVGNVVSVDDVPELKGESISFSLVCGEYYVSYRSNADNAEELYKMVVSAPGLK